MLQLTRLPAVPKGPEVVKCATEALETEGMGKKDRREPTEFEMKNKSKGWRSNKSRLVQELFK